MPSITVRDVPQHVRDALAAKAAGRGQSMQQYLLGELIRLSHQRTNREIIERAQERARRLGISVTTEQILRARDEGRAGM
jgi:antitoxin FitA